ncbi:unnamed protein product [Menidia menidia]|uniref:(Atlantic silverside) hypothetical protein n=1 Tax=Menidia menidia TaxID=238744 RepID=A0A8S4BNE4_9TELE|nr:unnamed protein product [Menidia menidia]
MLGCLEAHKAPSIKSPKKWPQPPQPQHACQGDSPLVTRYRRTWFLSGVESLEKGWAQENSYGVYAQISSFLGWLDGGPHPLFIYKPKKIIFLNLKI